MKIALLGWGSLLWDRQPDFDEQHGEWLFDGPNLKLEFSRISRTRNGALTLVLDSENGNLCQVAYAFSKRADPDDAICDLRCRERTTLKNIGFYFADDSRQRSRDDAPLRCIRTWATKKNIDVVIWTDLSGNFRVKSRDRSPFSVENAIRHVQDLDTDGKRKVTEYIDRTPQFIDTPLRRALQSQSWFAQHK